MLMTTNDIISDESLQKLHKAIQIYDKLKGKDYLIGYGTNSREKIEFNEIRITPSNFWHLLGYHVKDDIDYEIRPVLYNILLENDVSQFNLLKNSLECMHDKQTRDIKYKVFIKNFNFLYNAKITNLANTQNTPDKYNFDFAIGNDFGIVGYKEDDRKKNKFKNIPVTIQSKSIEKLNKPTKDIFLILSKNILSDIYDYIDYSVSKNIEFLRNTIHDMPRYYKVNVSINNIQITNNKVNNPKEIERE